ncbi:hypothetical protein PPO43_11575 [Saprospira sp. CCB-QB6]|nr:hypothetical protein [Saprospira sp. CCB-QB6]WCL80608.1 hypothetical protein PPO43_11575 [Saprospira sp. CCB-QB6]
MWIVFIIYGGTTLCILILIAYFWSLKMEKRKKENFEERDN